MWQGLPQRLRHVPFRVALNERLDEPGAGSRSFATKSPVQLVLHRIRLKAIFGCSPFGHFLLGAPSDSTKDHIWMQPVLAFINLRYIEFSLCLDLDVEFSKSSFSKSTGYGEKLEWMQKFSWTDISSSIRFGNKPEWMQKFSWTGLFAPIRFEDKPKRMEILCLSRQTT